MHQFHFRRLLVASQSGELVRSSQVSQQVPWMVKRYGAGSVSQASITARDAQGRPARVEESCAFTAMNGARAAGSVVVQFADGIPECMFFFDAPATCRTPSRKIITAYANGGYPQP